MLVEWLWQVKESIDRHGIRWGLVFAFYAILRKERRNYRLDKRDEIHNASFVAILKNQQLILEKMGVQPCADTLTLIENLSTRTQRGGYISLWPEKLRVRYAARKAIWSFIIWNIRRVIKMQLNKTWLVAVIVYLLAILGKKTGMTFTDELANQIADVVLTLILPLIMALLSHRKGQTDEKRPTDTGSAV